VLKGIINIKIYMQYRLWQNLYNIIILNFKKLTHIICDYYNRYKKLFNIDYNS